MSECYSSYYASQWICVWKSKSSIKSTKRISINGIQSHVWESHFSEFENIFLQKWRNIMFCSTSPISTCNIRLFFSLFSFFKLDITSQWCTVILKNLGYSSAVVLVQNIPVSESESSHWVQTHDWSPTNTKRKCKSGEPLLFLNYRNVYIAHRSLK